MPLANQCVRFVKPAVGPVDERHFELSTSTVSAPDAGEIIVRNVYLSLDPYQRRQMMPGVVYTNPLNIGDVMVGRAIGTVVESRDPRFAVGDWALGHFGWQHYTRISATKAEKIDLDGFSPSTFLGALGSPGVTAWVGLRTIAKVRAGETVVISAATGAVGSVAGALARATGCRVVGIAGGPMKCAHAIEALGFDACVDYKSANFRDELAHATPTGIDVDFENVGGYVFDCVLERMNDFGRVALCGLVSQYNLPEPYGMRNIAEVLNRNVMLQGYRVTSFPEQRPAALRELKDVLRSGVLRPAETIDVGLAQAPAAFVRLFQGANMGKSLVRLADETI